MKSWTAATPAYVSCLMLVLAALAISAIQQRALTAENGLGWDGSQYAQMTSQCWREPVTALEPFVYRIGAPCLAALLPATPKTSLFAVNVAASFAFMFLLMAWLRRFMPGPIALALIAVMAWHWLGPLRYSWWYPTYVDPLALCATVGALLLRDRLLPFLIICAAGAAVRETVLVVPCAMAAGRFITLAGSRDGRLTSRLSADTAFRTAVSGIVAGAAALLLSHAVVRPGSDYWMADSALYWAYSKPLPSYGLAWFVTYGPMLALPFARLQPIRQFLRAAPEYGILLLAVAGLAVVGGSDSERFLLWAAPIVLLLVGIAAAAVDWTNAIGPLALLVVGQMLNGRWFLPTPSSATTSSAHAWPILTPLRANRVEDLLSLNPDHVAAAVALTQYALLTLVLLVWLRRREA